MSVLLLLISALVLIYLGVGGTVAATVLVIATVVGLIPCAAIKSAAPC
jgi:acyl-CoA dehydrogenase